MKTSMKRAAAPLILTTGEFKEAVSLTQMIYAGNISKLAGRGTTTPDLIMKEAERAALLGRLLADDNLCEMLAGRVALLQHGERS